MGLCLEQNGNVNARPHVQWQSITSAFHFKTTSHTEIIGNVQGSNDEGSNEMSKKEQNVLWEQRLLIFHY